jgi:hypothetical protein
LERPKSQVKQDTEGLFGEDSSTKKVIHVMIETIQGIVDKAIPQGHPLRRLPYGKIVVTTGGSAVGSNQMHRNWASTRGEKLDRQLQRDRDTYYFVILGN